MTEPGTPPADIRHAQRAMAALARLALASAGIALLALVLVQGWQVIARYVLNDSPSWTEPVTVLLLSTLLGLGAAAGVHERRHFAFTLLGDALPPRMRALVRAIAELAIALLGAMLAWWGGMLFLDGLHIPTAGAPLPQGAASLPLALGGALMALFALAQLLDSARQLRGTP